MSNSPRVFTRLDKFIQRKWEELTPRLQDPATSSQSKTPSKQAQEKIIRLRKVLSEAREEVSFLEDKLSCRLAIEERKQHLEQEYLHCTERLRLLADDSRLYRELTLWGEQVNRRIQALGQKLG